MVDVDDLFLQVFGNDQLVVMGYNIFYIIEFVEYQCVFCQVRIRFVSMMIVSLNKWNEFFEILVFFCCCLNISQRDGMGCCIGDNVVNDLFFCFICLDVVFSEGKYVF